MSVGGLQLTVGQIRWIIDVIANVTDDNLLEYERTRLEDLLARANILAGGSTVSADEEKDAQQEFLDILDCHTRLRSAYIAMVSNQTIEITTKSFTYLCNIEKTRPLTIIESQRKLDAEEALRSHRELLKRYLDEAQE